MKSAFIGHTHTPKTPFVIDEKNNVSSFLGILEGKRKKAKAEAAAKVINAEKEKALALEESKRLSFQQQEAAAIRGFDPVKATADAEISKEKTKQQAETNLYLVLGGIVVAVMVGLYFIKRK